MRILVLQTAFLGDCVLSLPFLARLGDCYPDARIDVIAARGAGAEVFRIALKRGLASLASRVRIHEYDKRGAHRGVPASLAFARDLKGSEGYELAFCLQRSLRSALLALAAGARERVGFSSGAVPAFYTRAVRRDWEGGRSEVEKNLDLLRAVAPAPVELWSPRSAPSLLAKAPPIRPGAEAPILVSLGSPWATKRWPVENAIPLVERLTREGHEVRLIGDRDAEALSAGVRAKVPSLLLKDLTGKTSIEAWVDEIAGARLVLSGDSAAVHVASDLDIPVVALFGPTLPEFGFAPWRLKSTALGLALPCRPCHIHGPKACPLGHHRCLKDLQAESVHREMARHLSALDLPLGSG